MNLNIELIKECYVGNLDKVKSLVEKGAYIHVYNNIALSWAAYNGHLEVVKYLVENGADIHAEDNDYALRNAARNGYLEVVNYLKKVYSKKYKDKFLCHNCLVLPVCTKLCSEKLVKI